MKNPVIWCTLAIAFFCPHATRTADPQYTVKIALAIPFDFRDTGFHYTIPVVSNKTPITATVTSARSGKDLETELMAASNQKLAEMFSDIPEFQVVHLTTEKIAEEPSTYISLWLAPSVPQTQKANHHLSLGHITGVSDNTTTLNALFGVDLLTKVTGAINTYLQKKPMRFMVFLFAKDAQGDMVVTP